jgi:hypothetical protein
MNFEAGAARWRGAAARLLTLNAIEAGRPIPASAVPRPRILKINTNFTSNISL